MSSNTSSISTVSRRRPVECRVDFERLDAEGYEYWEQRVPGEPELAYLAYLRYRETQSYRKVCEELNHRALRVSMRQIRRWSEKYGWAIRREAWVRRRAEESLKLYYEALQTNAPVALATLIAGMRESSAPLRDRRQCAVDILTMLGLYMPSSSGSSASASNASASSLEAVYDEIRRRAQLESCLAPQSDETECEPDSADAVECAPS